MIREFDTFNVQDKEYEVRKVVCDVVVALNKSSKKLDFGIFTVPELIRARAFD